MSWFRSKCTHADVYETLLKRWSDIEARVSRLELNEDNIRNMARRVQQHKPKESEDLSTSTGGLLRNGVVPKTILQYRGTKGASS